MEKVLFQIAGKCQGCDEPIMYEVRSSIIQGYPPSVDLAESLNGTIAFGGGHICGPCAVVAKQAMKARKGATK